MARKYFISADFEGTNSTVVWPETEMGSSEYPYFRERMTNEVSRVAEGIHEADNDAEILIKDAHDTARNIIPLLLPEYVSLHRGWEGGPESMMAGLDKSFDAVLYVGYHSASRSEGNPLSHTMTGALYDVKVNGHIASEFELNSYFAAYLNVPVIFLGGDEELTKTVKTFNEQIGTVATKKGVHCAVVSPSPLHTDKLLRSGAESTVKAFEKNPQAFTFPLPKHFDILVEYKDYKEAYKKSFFPGARLVGTDAVAFSSDDWWTCMVALDFIL